MPLFERRPAKSKLSYYEEEALKWRAAQQYMRDEITPEQYEQENLRNRNQFRLRHIWRISLPIFFRRNKAEAEPKD